MNLRLLLLTALASTQLATAQLWQGVTGLPTNSIQNVACSADGQTLVVQDGANFLWRSTDGGSNWTQFPAPAASLASLALSTNGNHLAAVGYQVMCVSSNLGDTWTITTNNYNLASVTLSGDGSKLVAVGASGTTTGIMFGSSDYGASWQFKSVQPTVPPATFNQQWTSVASSADGTKLLLAAARNPGSFVQPKAVICYSTNSGNSWTSNALPDLYWTSVTMSTNGKVLAACSFNAVSTSSGVTNIIPGTIYVSTNSGANWFSNNVPLSSYYSMACSADGSRLVAVATDGTSCVSTNSGTSWSLYPVPYTFWLHLAASADGIRLIGTANSSLVMSTNGGADWTLRWRGASWSKVASSGHGSNLLAAAGTGILYTSTNAGDSWTQPSCPAAYWLAAAMSKDGNVLAVAGSPNIVFSSTNRGTTWMTNLLGTSRIASLRISPDGSRLMAVPSSGNPWYSIDSGQTWFTNKSVGLTFPSSVAMAADGLRLVAVGSSGVYTSTNFGTNWSAAPAPATGFWSDVTMSADGNQIAGVGYRDIYISRDFGATWTNCGLPSASWNAIAGSDDGLQLVALDLTTKFYSSGDGGRTWISNASPGAVVNWSTVACSSDGSKLIAAPASGQVQLGRMIPFLNLTSGPASTLVKWRSTQVAPACVLQTNSNLATTNWVDVGTTVSDDGTNRSVNFGPPSGQTFFRLILR